MKDKNKIISFIIVIALLFIGLFFFAKPGQNGNNATKTGNIPEGTQALANSHIIETNSDLTAEERFYDFGTISMKNGLVSKSFKVTNNSGQDIKLPGLNTSCMCTSAYFVRPDGNKVGPFGMPGMGFVPPLNQVIKAGESAAIEAVYDPNAHGPAGVGMIDRFVYLEDANGNKLQFEIKANVTP